jgi:SAM-dependent methyltransferase
VTEPRNESGAEATALWRGVDFSGLTVVLGVGTGRLIELLAQQVALARGTLVVISYSLRPLRALAPLRQYSALTFLHARPRQIPVLSETVDLLVVNGVLREVPDARLAAMFVELNRVLVPGGRIRITDIIAPSEAPEHRAWAERNRIVRLLGEALEQPTALAANIQRIAAAARALGLENLNLSFLPGYALNDAWLEDTIVSIRNMAGRLADPALRNRILTSELRRLATAYAQVAQTAAMRFVLSGNKVGELALDMEASFTEQDLQDTSDDDEDE